KSEPHFVANAQCAELGLRRSGQGLTVNLLDDVAGLQSGLRGGTPRIHFAHGTWLTSGATERPRNAKSRIRYRRCRLVHAQTDELEILVVVDGSGAGDIVGKELLERA